MTSVAVGATARIAFRSFSSTARWSAGSAAKYSSTLLGVFAPRFTAPRPVSGNAERLPRERQRARRRQVDRRLDRVVGLHVVLVHSLETVEARESIHAIGRARPHVL